MRFASVLQNRFAISAQRILPGASLGALGALINLVPLDLGWGLHLLFGGALVYAFMRVLSTSNLVTAIGLAGLPSIVLWNHPWGWFILILESVCIALFIRRRSPIITIMLFWVLIGTPLVWVTYGLILGMDQSSMLLVASKQAINGTLNVVLGELFYFLALMLLPHSERESFPRIPIDSFIPLILMGTVLIPSVTYLIIDAPLRRQQAEMYVASLLNERMVSIDNQLSLWVARTVPAILHHLEHMRGKNDRPSVGLPLDLSGEFSGIAIVAPDHSVVSSGSPIGKAAVALALQALAQRGPQADGRPQLVTISPAGSNQDQMALVLTVPEPGNHQVVIAQLKPQTFLHLISRYSTGQSGPVFLSRSGSRPLPLSSSSEADAKTAENFTHDLPNLGSRGTIIKGAAREGASAMEQSLLAVSASSVAVSPFPEWHLLAFQEMKPEVLKRRQDQLQVHAALCGFAVLIALVALLLSRQSKRLLRHIAQQAAELGGMGTTRRKIDDLVILELNDIAMSVASLNSHVSRERNALNSYQRRLKSVAERAAVIVYALHFNKKGMPDLVYVSGSMETILGYTEAEAKQTGWWKDAVHPDDFERCKTLFNDVLTSGLIDMEFRVRHKSGHYLWVSNKLSLDVADSSFPKEAVGVLIDVSQQKKAAEQLLQADKMVSLGRVMAGTAHELNQPLNFIKMASHNLQKSVRRHPMDPEQLVSKLELIKESVDRASTIILQMRIFGRTPAETSSSIDIKKAVDEMSVFASPQLQLDNTKLDLSGCRAGIEVRASPMQLQQVLLNLVLNANDAIRASRQTGDRKEGLIRLSIARDASKAIITVEDNGTGIPEGILATIFDPFFTTKPPKEGTGLGLSISYGIIKDLGGTIRAENLPDGARFIIELPIADGTGWIPTRID